MVSVVALVKHHAHAATTHLIKHSDCCPEQVHQLRVRQSRQLLNVLLWCHHKHGPPLGIKPDPAVLRLPHQGVA